MFTIHALLPEASSAQPATPTPTPRSWPSKPSPAGPPHSAGEAACRHHGETDGLVALKCEPPSLPKPKPNPIFRSFALVACIGLQGGGLVDKPCPAPVLSAARPRKAFIFGARLLGLRRASPVELDRVTLRPPPIFLASLEYGCRLAGEVPTARRSAGETSTAAVEEEETLAKFPLTLLQSVPPVSFSAPLAPPIHPPAVPPLLLPSTNLSGEITVLRNAFALSAGGLEWLLVKRSLERVIVGLCFRAAGDAGPWRDALPDE